ncbi:hypothetical protein ACVWZZ_005860 [Bradyrhizobium sp. LM6.10]
MPKEVVGLAGRLLDHIAGDDDLLDLTGAFNSLNSRTSR